MAKRWNAMLFWDKIGDSLDEKVLDMDNVWLIFFDN